jgi:hypothetical protein
MQYIIMRMAANCPASTPCILRGCVDAFLQADLAIQTAAIRVEAADGRKHRSAVKSKASTLESRPRKEANSNSPDHDEGGPEETNGIINEQTVLSEVREQSVRIFRVSSAAILLIAELSDREAFHAVRLVEQVYYDSGGLLVDLLLRLYVNYDARSAVNLILKELTHGKSGAGSGQCCQGKSFDHTASTGTQIDGGDISSRVTRSFEDVKRRRNVKRFAGRPSLKPGKGRKTVLLDKLLEDEDLSCDVRAFFVRLMSDVKSRNMDVAFASVTVHAFGVLLLQIGTGSGSATGSGSSFVSQSLRSLDDILNHGRLTRDQGKETHANEQCSSLLTFMLAASVSLCSIYPPIGQVTSTERFMSGSIQSSIQMFMAKLFAMVPYSTRTFGVFAMRVARFALSNEGNQMKWLVVKRLLNAGLLDINVSTGTPEDSHFFNVCSWIQQKLHHDLLTRASTQEITTDSSIRCFLEIVSGNTFNVITPIALVTQIMCDSNTASAMLSHSKVLHFLRFFAIEDARAVGGQVPRIMPLDVAHLARSVDWMDDKELCLQMGRERSKALLQIYYSIVFAEECPTSSFKVDVAALPAEHVIGFCRRRSTLFGDNYSFIGVLLGLAVSRNCPEKLLSRGYNEFLIAAQAVSMSNVSEAIRACPLKVDSGERAELLYYRAHHFFSCSEVDSVAASALLSQDGSPAPFVSYARLIGDPLTLIKCSLRTWRNRSLRNILLTVLQRILIANNCFAHQHASNKGRVANEYTFARDLIVMRNVVIAAAGPSASTSSNFVERTRTVCNKCSSIVRALIVSNPGLIISVIRQGLAEKEIDWIIRSSPECALDANGLVDMMSSCSFLTASERISIADFALRVAFSFGARGVVETQLLYLALAILTSSFYLILGPVGLPVNVLCENEGIDSTQEIRHKAFRMLGVLSQSPGKAEGIKREVMMALSKLVTSCKNEGPTSGLSGKQRKAVISELWESTNRVLKGLGGAQQYQRQVP